ncbi:MAG: FAD-binding protein [Dethiobacter sp.]|jgi:fumarate reductase flavoprotein subunit|nr:FAD-binding protein [Dethiobacter sp.]MBS3901928.1 FAD-binding protein [Dethiobacter sp.]MBS3989501.1 FAD-binding protein [Dethiobacter sp.]
MPGRRKTGAVPFLQVFILLAVIVFLLGSFSLQRSDYQYPPLPRSADVIVLGSGISGASAALSAAEAGVDVFYLYEDESDKGGFPAFSPAFWVSGAPAQQEAKLDYPAEIMAAAIYERTQETGNASLILSFSERSSLSLSWLEKKTGVPFTVFADAESNPGLLLPQRGEAAAFVNQALLAQVAVSAVEFSGSFQPVELLIENGRVQGLVVRSAAGEQLTIYARAIILADGGYGANMKLLAELADISEVTPRLEGGHHGTGLLLAMAAGAKTENLDSVTLLPVFLPAGVPVNQEVFSAAVVLNANGEIVAPGDNLAQTIIDAGGRLFIIHGSQTPQSERNFNQIKDVQSLASGLGLGLEKTTALVGELTAPYFVAVAASVALTPGGLVVDRQMRVLAADGAVEGLYAAGEIIAGLHGKKTISSLVFSEAITTGLLAGEQAAAWARR